MPVTGQLGATDSSLGNIELGGVAAVTSPPQYPTPIFEVNFTDDPIAAHRDIVMSANPLAYWRLGDTSGTTATDETDNTYVGTYTGGFTLDANGATGDDDPAVSLNGTSGYVDIPNYSNVFRNLTTAYSISAWSYPTSTRIAAASDAAGVITYEYSAGPIPFAIGYGRDETLGVLDNRFWAGYFTGSAWNIIQDPTDVSLDEWVHHVLTWDSTADLRKLVLYRNGVEIGYSTPSVAVVAGTTGLKTFIGKRWDNSASGTDEFFPGRIDDVAIYDRAMAPIEVAKLYASGIVRSVQSKEGGFVDYSTIDVDGIERGRIRQFSIRRGRSSEIDRVEAGSLTITLDNRDGAFNPDPDNGVLPMRQARLKARYGLYIYPLLSGYIERYSYDYPGLDADATVTLTITDGFKAIAQQAVTGILRPAEPVADRLLAIFTAAAIPDDQASIDDTHIYPANLAPIRSSDVSTELPPITVTGTLSDGSTSVTGISSTTGIVVGMAVTGGGIPAGTTVSVVVSGTALTLSAAANISGSKTVEGLPNSAVLFGMSDTSDLSVGMSVDLGNNTNGQPMDQPGSVIASIDSGSQITMNLPTYNVTFRGSGMEGGFANATFTASASQSLTFQNETLSISGALDHIRQIEATELGVFLVSPDGTFTYQGRYYRDAQTVAFTFGDQDLTVDVPYAELPITYDESNVANEYRISNTYNQTTQTTIDIDSVRRYFPRLITFDQVWHTNLFTIRERTEAVPRIDSLVMKPARDPARLWPAALDLEISDKVDVERHAQGGDDVLTGYSQFVEGISHDARPGEWVVVLNVSPEQD